MARTNKERPLAHPAAASLLFCALYELSTHRRGAFQNPRELHMAQ